jgi:hypothetical protein
MNDSNGEKCSLGLLREESFKVKIHITLEAADLTRTFQPPASAMQMDVAY